MAEDKTAPQTEYHVVDSTTLRAGWLVERSLFIHMKSMGRYILMVKALHPLEQPIIDKLKRTGHVYSKDPAIEQEFPKLVSTTHEIRAILDDLSEVSFERHRKILDLTRWVIPHAWDVGMPEGLLPTKVKPHIPAVLMHRAIGVPRAETLQHVSDSSVMMYERAVMTAALAGLYSIWLGHTDLRLISRFVEMVFCEELSVFASGGGAAPNGEESPELGQSELSASLELVQGGKVPGIRAAAFDRKIAQIFDSRAYCAKTGEELLEILELARARALGQKLREKCFGSRALRKLNTILAKEALVYIEELEEEKKREEVERLKRRAAA